MVKPYVSKRRKIADNDDKKDQDKLSNIDLTSKSSGIAYCHQHTWLHTLKKDFHLVLKSYSNQISWSIDGKHLVICQLNGSVGAVIIENDMMKYKELINIGLSVPHERCWSSDSESLQIATFDGKLHWLNHCNGNSTCTTVDKLPIENINSVAYWNDSILFGLKSIYLIENMCCTMCFGYKDNHVSCMIVVNDILFVAYDYNQSSSADKSIAAYHLPSGVPIISTQLTDQLFSYVCLVSSPPFVYGLTSNGILTRFRSDSPYKMDRKFKRILPIPQGYKLKFDIKGSVIAYGDDSGNLIFQRIFSSDKQTVVPPSLSDYSSPIVNVKFHPHTNTVAFCRWNGTLGVVRQPTL